MKTKLTVFLGIFTVMALSNAIVPVLPFFADELPAIQGIIFSAYFLGAFLTVLPAGVLSDKIGKMPLIKAGLIFTVFSGIIMLIFQNPFLITGARIIEGISAGLFVSCTMSWVNEQPDHKNLSGYYFASLNLGLVLGLLASGILNPYIGASGGILLFTILSIPPALLSFYAETKIIGPEKTGNPKQVAIDFKWLFLSVIILTGATGVVTSLYPDFTDGDPLILSIQIGAMNVATIFASLFAPHLNLRPVPSIKYGAVFMAVFVFLSYALSLSGTIITIIVFAFIGAIAGFIMIGQMDFLAGTQYRQGTVMGLFNTSGYAGMTFLPFFAGIIAQFSGYLPAFLAVSGLSVIIALFIDRCTKCRL
jgi:MFS family permease